MYRAGNPFTPPVIHFLRQLASSMIRCCGCIRRAARAAPLCCNIMASRWSANMTRVARCKNAMSTVPAPMRFWLNMIAARAASIRAHGSTPTSAVRSLPRATTRAPRPRRTPMTNMACRRRPMSVGSNIPGRPTCPNLAGSGGATDWEIGQLYQSGRLGSTGLYSGGQYVPNPF